jgi:myo-inositol-1(or 4)-monophosphatase
VAGNPKIYGQLVGILGKYSKFASAGEKADLRQNTPTLVEPTLEPGTQVDEGPAQGA